LSVAILSGWFVVTRLGLHHDLRIRDVIALVPVTTVFFAIPFLDEWPSGAAICVVALGVVMAAASANPANKKGESK